MSVTKIFAVTLLVSTGAAFAPAFADDNTNPVIQVAAIEAQLPVNPATEAVPVNAPGNEAVRAGQVKSADEVRALLFGVAPTARSNEQTPDLIRDVAAMYQFQHYRPLRTSENNIAGFSVSGTDKVPN